MQQTNKCNLTKRINNESKRYRWLTETELQRLWAALGEYHDQSVANAIRLLLLTGSRRNEVLYATWDQFDLSKGIWAKPVHTTKHKKMEYLPLSSQVLELLRAMKEDRSSDFLFPGKIPGKPLQDIKKAWAALCECSNLRGFRISGLRETYASHLVASGISFGVIDRLLGYSRRLSIIPLVPLTFERLKQATEVLSNKIEKIASNTSSNQKPINNMRE